MRKLLPLFTFALAVSAPVAAAEVVPVAQFRSIQLQGGGEVLVRYAPAQRVTLVAGSTRFTDIRVTRGGKLEIDACNRRCPNRYRLRILVDTPSISALGVSGGGEISAAPGFRPQRELSAAVSGGGEVDVRALPADTVAAAVNGGGQVLVRPRVRLSAAVNGGGSVRYWGSPQVASVVNGGGSIVRGR